LFALSSSWPDERYQLRPRLGGQQAQQDNLPGVAAVDNGQTPDEGDAPGQARPRRAKAARLKERAPEAVGVKGSVAGETPRELRREAPRQPEPLPA
jgi:hypothetical protein